MSEQQEGAKDWTVKDGVSNSSDRFEDCVTDVASILANHRLGAPLEATARLIVARLAHIHRLAPR